MASKVQFVMDADTAKVVQNFDKLQNKLKDMERKFTDVQLKAASAARAQRTMTSEGSTGADKMGKKIVQMGTAFMGVSAVIGIVRTQFANLHADMNRAMELVKSLEPTHKKLSQLAPTQKRYAELKEYAKGMAMDLGMKIPEAETATFDIVSAGLETDIKDWRATHQVESLTTTIPTIGKLRKLYPGLKGRDALNMLLSISGKSLEALGGVGEMVVKPAAQARALGLRPEEMMGLVGGLVGEAPSPMEASTWAARYLRRAAKGIPVSVLGAGAQEALGRISSIEGEITGIDARRDSIEGERRKYHRELEDRDVARTGRRVSPSARRREREERNQRERSWEDELLALDARRDLLDDERSGLIPKKARTQKTLNLKGLGLVGMAQQIEAWRKDPEIGPQVDAWLSSDAFSNAVQGYIIGKTPELESAIGKAGADAAKRGRGEPIWEAMERRRRDPEDVAQIRSRRAQAIGDVGLSRRLGGNAIEKEAFLQLFEEEMVNRGFGRMRRWAAKKYVGVGFDLAGPGESFDGQEFVKREFGFTVDIEKSMKAQLEAGQKLIKAAEKIDQAAENLLESGKPGANKHTE
jgi:hypothetical protein